MIPDQLVRAVSERRVILFAGAGVSMNVGLPSWQQLIEHLGEELELDTHNFLGPDVSYHTLAEYYRIKQGSIGPLRSGMDRKWKVSGEAVKARARKKADRDVGIADLGETTRHRMKWVVTSRWPAAAGRDVTFSKL